jgi:hypothetical protein
MSWAGRRRFKYLLGLSIIVGLIVFAFLYPVLFKEPTCFDGKLNGTEQGIDCGGECALICQEEIFSPSVLWSRAFSVLENNYNLVALVENRNKEGAVAMASYEFRVYDKNNKLLGRREGQTFIPPNQQFAVFEPRFNSGQSEIKTVTFEFLSPLVWVKKPPTIQTLPIKVKNIVLDNNENTPTLSAMISNESIQDLPEFDVIAILYDADKNAINASKTRKEKLLNGESLSIFFTWPEPLTSAPVNQEILLLINPFSLSF